MSEEQVFTQCTVGGPVRVYVEDGVIKRMRPIRFDDQDAAVEVFKKAGCRLLSDDEVHAL